MNAIWNFFAANDAVGTIIVLVIAGIVWFFNWLNDQRNQAPQQPPARPPGSRIDWETLRGGDRPAAPPQPVQASAKPSRRERKEQKKKQQAKEKEEAAPNKHASSRASSIRDDLKNRSFEGRSQKFAERVETDTSTKDVESRVDEHVHEVFDHDVGTMAGQDAYTASPAAQAAAAGQGTFDWLTKPESVRQAIIMQEILNRKF